MSEPQEFSIAERVDHLETNMTNAWSMIVDKLEKAEAARSAAPSIVIPTDGGPMIHAAIVGVMRDIEAVGKNQSNDFHHYKFRGIDDVYNAVHIAMAKNGMYNTFEVLERTETIGKTSSGKERFRIVQKMKFTFCALDGSSIEVGPIYSEAMDNDDKASNKANSNAHKYALLMLFCIPTQDLSDDGDKESPASADPLKEEKKKKDDRDPAEKVSKDDVSRFETHRKKNKWSVAATLELMKKMTDKEKFSELTFGELDLIAVHMKQTKPPPPKG